MSVTLKELDELWEGQNLDESSLKLLCRRYSPTTILEWIHRGLTIHNKENTVTWHREKLAELGVDIPELPPEVEDERLEEEDHGDYFSE